MCNNTRDGQMDMCQVTHVPKQDYPGYEATTQIGIVPTHVVSS